MHWKCLRPCQIAGTEHVTKYSRQTIAAIRQHGATCAHGYHAIGLFAGSDTGGECIANILTIIETVKLQGHNPEVYLTDVLTRIQNHPKDRIEDLMPWNWVPANARCEAA